MGDPQEPRPRTRPCRAREQSDGPEPPRADDAERLDHAAAREHANHQDRRRKRRHDKRDNEGQAPALGPAAMVSASRGAAIRAAGRMIAKATRYRALSTSCSCSIRGGGSGVGLVRINTRPITGTKSPIASATVRATVGPRGALRFR